jgi:hypothetical protein
MLPGFLNTAFERIPGLSGSQSPPVRNRKVLTMTANENL